MSSIRRQAATPRTGLPAGLVAIAGGALGVIGAFLAWLTSHTETGGSFNVSGFGTISGASDGAGENLNEMLGIGGLGSYRPGLLGLVFGLIAIAAGVVVALVRPTAVRPYRIAGSLLALCGFAELGWGLFRGIAPGTAGILEAGEGNAGAGPWMTAVGGLVLCAVAVWLLLGRSDPFLLPVRPRSSGIQESR